MHIALHHDAVVPPRKYGGTERVLAWLAKGLLSLGHQVTLIAREGSQVPGAHFVHVDPKNPDSWRSALPSAVDLIHFSGTPSGSPEKPFLVTIHGNGKPGEKFHKNTVFLSRSHAENHGGSVFVHNGIDPEEYPCDKTREDYLVFLAKASWKVKNLAGAIQVARAAGLPIEILGSRELPWPLGAIRNLFSGNVHYRGMVDDDEKKQILRRAAGLVFPVRWNEPFGLAVIEALASGCPVFGTPYGSLPEIVVPGVGALDTRSGNLAKAIRENTYSPSACRQRVYAGFTHLDMAKSYAALYERILSQGSLIPASSPDPKTRSLKSAETLLPWN